MVVPAALAASPWGASACGAPPTSEWLSSKRRDSAESKTSTSIESSSQKHRLSFEILSSTAKNPPPPRSAARRTGVVGAPWRPIARLGRLPSNQTQAGGVNFDSNDRTRMYASKLMLSELA
jgi:hypothetical protein